MQYIVLKKLHKSLKYFAYDRYSASSELYDRSGCLPPVATEVIYIKPLSWLRVAARSSIGAFLRQNGSVWLKPSRLTPHASRLVFPFPLAYIYTIYL